METSSLYDRFKLKKITVPKNLLSKTQEFLRYYGRYGYEGMVFWTGVKSEGKAIVKNCINPKQSCTAVSVDIPLYESQQINTFLDQNKEVLIAQVHSHPGNAFHSHRDDTMPATYTVGFFSLVIPNFCQKALNDLSAVVICEYIGGGEWKTLACDEIDERFIII